MDKLPRRLVPDESDWLTSPVGTLIGCWSVYW